MSEYPSKEEYTEETLRSDGGAALKIKRGTGALKKSPRMSSKDMAMAVEMLPVGGELPIKALGRAALSKNPRMSKADAMNMSSILPKNKSAKKRKGPR